MKRLLICSCFAAALSLSQAYSQGPVRPPAGSPGETNPVLLLNKEDSKKAKKNYRDLYNNTSSRAKTHTKSILIEKKSFGSIHEFISKYSSLYDGINIHFAVYKRKKVVNSQAHRKQITLFFTPAKKIPFHQSDYTPDFMFEDSALLEGIRALNHGELCPDSCSDESDDPAGLSSTSSSDFPNSIGVALSISEEEARKFKNNFKNIFGSSSINYSRSVFVHADNLAFISRFFKEPANSAYNGVRIIFVSYKSILVNGQQQDDQVSMMLAPTIGRRAILGAFHTYYLNLPNPKPPIQRPTLCPGFCPDIEDQYLQE